MRRLFQLAREARGTLAVMLVAVGVAAAATVAQMLVAAHIITAAFWDSATRVWPLRDADVAPSLVLLFGLILVRAVAVGVTEVTAQRLATRVKSRLRLAVIASLIVQGRGLAAARTGELVTTTLDGVEKLDPFYRRFVPQVTATCVTPLVIAAAAAFVDPLSAVILALTGPLIPLFMWLLGTMAQRRARAQWSALTQLAGRFLDTVQGLPTLTLFNRAPEAALAVEDSCEALRVRTMRVLRVAFLSGAVLELAASVSIALVAAGIGVRLIEGWMPFDAGLAMLLLAPEFYLPFRQLAQRHHAGMEGAAAAEQIFRLLDDAAPAADAACSADGVPPRSGTLTLQGLEHRYPDCDHPTLRGVSATFTSRSLSAIVGPSGAGKSTLLNVMLRLTEPAAGEMAIGGCNSRGDTPAAWRRHFALVPQRPRFIYATIAENLRLARATATGDEIRAAAQLAHVDAVIEALPQGYETVIDEQASSLSGGERQRLALARALVKNAPILLLDEPTAALDPVTEAAIDETLLRLRHQRTVIVVSHRPGITEAADQVITLAEGRVVAITPVREVA